MHSLVFQSYNANKTQTFQVYKLDIVNRKGYGQKETENYGFDKGDEHTHF